MPDNPTTGLLRLGWKWLLKPFFISVGVLTCLGAIYLCALAFGIHHAMTNQW